MTDKSTRLKVLADIEQALIDGAGFRKACNIVGVSYRTIKRWKLSEEDKRQVVNKTSSKALTPEEKQNIISVCNQHEYKDMTPNKIVPLLAGKGIYIASESMFYKVLKEYNQLKHRGNSKIPKKPSKIKTLVATAPNQLLSWDITYLKTDVKGIFFYLYLFMDVYSRKIMGWRVEDEENGELAKEAIENICISNDLSGIKLHSDNGSPMKNGTMLAALNSLGVTASYSRPSVSNDNPFSESLFKTLKYRAGYPKEFSSLDEARKWVKEFVKWYNTEHLHSSIKFVTPEQRHLGLDKEILEKRKRTYEEAKKKNPQRWVKGTRNWDYIDKVELKGSVKLIEPRKIA